VSTPWLANSQCCTFDGKSYIWGTQVKQVTVDSLHEKYYSEVARLFQEHKEGFSGYEDVRLAFASS
jgi:hypothetical protein